MTIKEIQKRFPVGTIVHCTFPYNDSKSKYGTWTALIAGYETPSCPGHPDTIDVMIVFGINARHYLSFNSIFGYSEMRGDKIRFANSIERKSLYKSIEAEALSCL